MSTINPHSPPPPVRGVRLLPVSPHRWRVLDRSGTVLGLLRAEVSADGIRYCAERFTASLGAMRELGRFWDAKDAVACLRHLR